MAPYDESTRRLAELNPEYRNAGHCGGGWPAPYLRPPLVQFFECRRVRIEGVTLRNSPFWNTHIVLCDDVAIHAVNFENPETAPNGDGLDIDSSTAGQVKRRGI